MNNLLRTLTESQVKPVADLRLLLTTIKESRRNLSQDLKLSDPFYDSLEGLLGDLKTITIDNRDAEAFLKPVSKSEVPDYYDVITNPMDFQTMLRKVKQKQYKSKREFRDDLDLIWSNCYMYNASENHPLRQCVNRLKGKAERLLKYITDRKERTDPSIPSDLPSPSGIARPKLNGINGYLNGHSSHTRSPSFSAANTPTSAFFRSNAMSAKRSSKDLPFADTPALIRTPEGMSAFLNLDRELELPRPKGSLAHKLRELAPIVEYDSDSDPEGPDINGMDVDEPALGDKRKLNGSPERRARKRARFTAQYPTPLLDEQDDLSQLWWGAVQSDALLANGLPEIPFGPSSSSPCKVKKPKSKTPKAGPSKKFVKKEHEDIALPTLPSNSTNTNPKALLTMMNNNIKTMRRVRHTHAKFTALNATSAPADEDDQIADGPATGLFGHSGSVGPGRSSTAASGFSFGSGFAVAGGGFGVAEEDSVDDKIDEAPWVPGRAFGSDAGGKIKGKGKEISQPGRVEIGEANGSECLRWAGNKVLEHAGFQGASKVALDVFADITAQYFQNVGRTMRFLSDTFGQTMTPEEIILHTLFESGSSKVQDMERFISDEIERYGSRLGELEKKLVGAYRETTAGDNLEDEGLFEEDEEETGALAMGEFADLLGEDYLGLRELGIAAEFGLSGLSVPKKLMRGKKGSNKPTAAKPTEPPPPYPPPPPFIPLTAAKVEDQIGLLKPYYQERIKALTLAAQHAPPISFSLPGPPLLGSQQFGLAPLPGPAFPAPPPPPLLPPSLLPPNTLPQTPVTQAIAPTPTPSAPLPPPNMVIPDDTPLPVQVKMGPIGQIVKAGSSGAAAKKKNKPQTSDGPGPGAGAGSVVAVGTGTSTGVVGGGDQNANGSGTSPSPTKKKKGNTGVGSGNGRKKKVEGGPGGGYGPGGMPFPPAIVASG